MAQFSVQIALASLFIKMAYSQSDVCQVFNPAGWEDGKDSSGIRSSKQTASNEGERVNYNCPGAKVGSQDGKRSYSATCTKGLSEQAEFVFEFGEVWPTCSCPDSLVCEFAEGSGSSFSATRYASQDANQPGLNIKIPIPKEGIKDWSVKIFWDIDTNKENIHITSLKEDVVATKLDYEGKKYSFSHVNRTKPEQGQDGDMIHINMMFDFSEPGDSQTQRWRYPCIEKLECQATLMDPPINWLRVLMFAAGVMAAVLLCGVTCGSITWCLKKEAADSEAAKLKRTTSIRPMTQESYDYEF